MEEDKNRRIFADNLNRIMLEHEKTPANLNADLGIPYSTLSNWTNAVKMPRMGKVALLANYFGCEVSDLLEEHSAVYYENRDAKKLAQGILENRALKSLLDVQMNMDDKELEAMLTIALALKKKETE